MEEKMKEAGPSDFILEILISMVEWAETADDVDLDRRTIGITLTVGGLLVTGELISAKTYMDEFLRGTLRDKMRSAIEENDSLKQQIENAPEGEDFIHLRNTKFLLPTGQPPVPGVGNGVLWRGRRSSVDGFFVGLLGVAGK
jgi:hypothetical protein